MDSVDVVVVGAGIVGAACAFYAARAGLSVTVIDRGAVAGGSTSGGEGNILTSDKAPGPELELARLSLRLWRRLGPELPGIELEPKGSLVVAATPAELAVLHRLVAAQRRHGVTVHDVAAAHLTGLEPHLTPELAGGAQYPDDLQVQPMLAAAHLLRAARSRCTTVHCGVELIAGRRDRAGRLTAVHTNTGTIATGAVVNAAGTWAGTVATRLGSTVPVQPRRGFILVTEPLGDVVRHKVYAAGYVADVASGTAGLRISAVVEGTRAGTVLIGASRELVGFDHAVPVPLLRRLAEQAIRLFPVLGRASVIRAYHGFRPFTPDHLPIVGADPRVPGLFHACGHEGAGIGLAPATGHLIARLLAGTSTALDLTPFRPDRFPP